MASVVQKYNHYFSFTDQQDFLISVLISQLHKWYKKSTHLKHSGKIRDNLAKCMKCELSSKKIFLNKELHIFGV